MLDFLKVKTHVDHLRDEVNQIRSNIEEKKRQRQDLETLPLPRKDLANLVCEWVDQEAKQFPSNLRHGINFLINRPNIDVIDRSFALLHVGAGGYNSTTQLPPANLCYLLGDLIKSNLRRAFDEMDYPDDVGPTRAARPAMLAKLNKEIASLEAKEAELVAHADSVGISL